MKQSVEKQIRSAFEAWDEEKNDLGFNKEALWNQIQPQPVKRVIHYRWQQLAAVAIILLLAAGWLFTFSNNRQLQRDNHQLALALQQQLKTITPTQKHEPPKTVNTSPKIVYKTEIKEVESPQIAAAYKQLTKKYETSETENSALKQQLHQSISSARILTDSINTLLATMQDQANSYVALEKTSTKKPNKNLSLKVDEEALLALAEQESKTPITSRPSSSKRKIKIRLLSKTEKTGSTTPILNSFTLE